MKQAYISHSEFIDNFSDVEFLSSPQMRNLYGNRIILQYLLFYERDYEKVAFHYFTSCSFLSYAKLKQGVPPDCVNQIPSIELARLYSMQEYLGCGIGPALMKACINYAREKNFKSIWLSSWKKNSRGNAFYTKMGFQIIGTATFALGSDIQDDYIFTKSTI